MSDNNNMAVLATHGKTVECVYVIQALKQVKFICDLFATNRKIIIIIIIIIIMIIIITSNFLATFNLGFVVGYM